MRGRLAIFLTIALVLVILVALNAASYVRVEQEPDTEWRPNRSTTNAGATGTRALYEFLQQSGQRVARWTEPPSALLAKRETTPTTFVVIGQLRRPFKKEEARALRRWVHAGGRLVLIDRTPDPLLLPSSGGWGVNSEMFEYPARDVQPDDAEAMTKGVRPLAPTQPTLLTRDVENVLPSRYAGHLKAYTLSKEEQQSAEQDGGLFGDTDIWTDEPPPATDDDLQEVWHAPVRHLPHGGGEEASALLVDYAYGRGRIVVLADPYVVSNSGISRADNLHLAANVVMGAGGLVVFDEYHQGLGAGQSSALRLFEGTPVLWIFGQVSLVVLAVLWSRGRRFARPLPAPHVDRRSKLEFVASMAELQQRARAYSLAVENVYARTRRALARYAGLEPGAPHDMIAARVAARAGKDYREIETLLGECEAATERDAAIPAHRSLALVRRLRELERDLGIRMRAREIRQEIRRQK